MEVASVKSRYTGSARHTIQRDPILYNDEIAAEFGAKPSMWRHPTLAWRLLLGSCGAAQWRLQGPHKNPKAREMVEKVPVTGLLHYSMVVILLVLSYWPIRLLFRNRGILVSALTAVLNLLRAKMGLPSSEL